MSDELKPCPCCGSERLETTENINESNNLGRCGAVWCECGLHMSARTLEEAVARWNARAERTCRIKWRGDSRFGLFVIPEDYYEDDGQYVCTACGEPLPDCVDHWWDSYQADGYEGEPPFRCCPNCGARIEVMRG